MRNNSCSGGCGRMREAMRCSARESVAFARRRRGGLGWLHLGVENLDEFGRSEDVRWGMWKCESVKIWKYENMKMPSSAVVASGYDAGRKNTREFNRFVDEGLKFALFYIFTLPDYLEPNAGFRKLFHGNFELMDKILPRFGFGSLCIIGGNACRGAENLVCKTTAADSLNRQCYAYFYASRGKLDDPVFKVSFHVQSFPYFHSFILAYFHTFTISPSASHGEFVSSSSSSHLRVPILNGIRRSRRQAFANTTNAVDIDIPMSLQNCPNSLLRSSSMRILNATCAIVISPVCKNSCIVSYSAANCNRATCSLEF